MNRQLIINADDLGLSNGVNQGIISCHQAGSVSSTTMMVNMPAADEAFSLIRINPDLGVGLHFNLTLGEPLSDKGHVASLLGSDGQFLPRAVAEKKAIAGEYKPAQIKCELKKQWEHFRAFGMTPTHLDSHQHIHVFPLVFDVVAQFCVDHDLPLRIPWPWKPPSRVPLKRRVRSWMLKRMINRSMKQWVGRLRFNSSFASIFDLQLPPNEINLEQYRNILNAPHRSTLELMVHPSMWDEEHQSWTRISATSVAEYEILKLQNLGDVARALGYELVNYSNI